MPEDITPKSLRDGVPEGPIKPSEFLSMPAELQGLILVKYIWRFDKQILAKKWTSQPQVKERKAFNLALDGTIGDMDPNQVSFAVWVNVSSIEEIETVYKFLPEVTNEELMTQALLVPPTERMPKRPFQLHSQGLPFEMNSAIYALNIKSESFPAAHFFQWPNFLERLGLLKEAFTDHRLSEELKPKSGLFSVGRPSPLQTINGTFGVPIPLKPVNARQLSAKRSV